MPTGGYVHGTDAAQWLTLPHTTHRARQETHVNYTHYDYLDLAPGADSARIEAAYIALLDESVLSSAQPMFADWSRQPLQEEVFGEHMAGENFFRTLQDALGRQDSDEVADLLEVFQLCLLLGFHGRYGSDATGLRTVEATLRAKIQRVRGGAALSELAPDWRRPQNERVAAARDPWARRLIVIAGIALGVAIVLYVVYRAFLASSVGDLRSLV